MHNMSYDQNNYFYTQKSDLPPKYEEIEFKKQESTIQLKPDGDQPMPVLPGTFIPSESEYPKS